MTPRYFWLPVQGGRHVVTGARHAWEVAGQQRVTLCGLTLAVTVVPPTSPAWYTAPTCQACHDAALELPEEHGPIPLLGVAR